MAEIINLQVLDDPELRDVEVGFKFVPILTKEVVEELSLVQEKNDSEPIVVITKELINDEVRKMLENRPILVHNGMGDEYDRLYTEVEKSVSQKNASFEICNELGVRDNVKEKATQLKILNSHLDEDKDLRLILLLDEVDGNSIPILTRLLDERDGGIIMLLVRSRIDAIYEDFFTDKPIIAYSDIEEGLYTEIVKKFETDLTKDKILTEIKY